MPVVKTNEIDINYQETGVGFPVILLHGLSDDLNLWNPIVPELSQKYRTICIDVRGHGHSGKPDSLYSIRQFCDDLFVFMDKLEISRAHLIGLSMGAAIVQQFAFDHPEKTGSIVLLSAFERVEGGFRTRLLELRSSLISGGVSAFFDEAIKFMVTPEFKSAHAEAIAESKGYCIQTNSAAALIHALDACMSFDIHAKLSNISVPALVLCGKEDAFTSNELGWKVYHAIKGAKWRIMPGVGHNLVTPENVPALSLVVLEFLAATSANDH